MLGEVRAQSAICDEAGRLWSIGFPMVTFSLMGFMQSTSSLMIVGRCSGRLDLAGAALGSTYSNIMGRTILVGISQSVDTLCSQQYGAGRFLAMGATLQRGIALLWAAASVASLLFWFAGDALAALGQPLDLAWRAGTYTRIQIPGLYAFALCMALQRYLAAQHRARPLFWVSLGLLPLHITVTYFLVSPVYGFGLGFRGAAISWNLTNALGALVLVICAARAESRRPRRRKMWPGWAGTLCRSHWREWTHMLRVSLPAMAMLATEYWTYEVLTLFAGLLPDAETAVVAQAIGQQLIGFIFMLSYGLSGAVCVRVGAELGSGRPRAAWRVVFSALAILMVQWAAVGGVFLIPAVRSRVAWLYDASPGRGARDIHSLVAAICPIIVAQQLFDGAKEVFNGVFRGAGLQSLGMITSFVAYFIVCLPIAYILGFRVGGLSVAPGVKGLFASTVVATAVHTALNAAVAMRIDWTRESKRIRDAAAKAEAKGADIAADEVTLLVVPPETNPLKGNARGPQAYGALSDRERAVL